MAVYCDGCHSALYSVFHELWMGLWEMISEVFVFREFHIDMSLLLYGYANVTACNLE